MRVYLGARIGLWLIGFHADGEERADAFAEITESYGRECTSVGIRKEEWNLKEEVPPLFLFSFHAPPSFPAGRRLGGFPWRVKSRIDVLYNIAESNLRAMKLSGHDELFPYALCINRLANLSSVIRRRIYIRQRREYLCAWYLARRDVRVRYPGLRVNYSSANSILSITEQRAVFVCVCVCRLVNLPLPFPPWLRTACGMYRARHVSNFRSLFKLPSHRFSVIIISWVLYRFPAMTIIIRTIDCIRSTTRELI